MAPDPIICDTSVWLYTGRIGQIELVHQLYDSVLTTETVCWELDNGRLSRPDTPDVRSIPWVRIVQPDSQALATLPANRLGPGEQSVLAYAHLHQIQLVGLDDQQARKLAQRLGLSVTGTLGVLLKAKQAGLIPAVRPLLQMLQHEGFYISDALLRFALVRASEQ